MEFESKIRTDAIITRKLTETKKMKVLRSITNRTLRDRVRSEDIRWIYKLDNVCNWMKERQTEWDEHMKRMNDR